MVEKLEDIVPRLEFRAFAGEFGRVVDEIRRRAPCLGIKESLEYYLVTAFNDQNNVKIRNNQLDIKNLIGLEQGLERWRPILKLDFPTSAGEMWNKIFSSLNVAIPAAPGEEVSMQTFIEDVLWPHPDIHLAQVFKRRFFFFVDECRVEITELGINGAAIQSIAIEDEDADIVLEVQKAVGLTVYKNVNYVLALKRIMGMIPLAEREWRMD